MAIDKKTGTASERETPLPPVINGEVGTLISLTVVERKTTPPKPYTEGALIEDMANCSKYVDDPRFRKTLKAVSGLGTAATRAAIIEDLKKYGMFSSEKGKLFSTEKGRALIKYLPQELYDIARTAVWEAELGLIGEGAGSPIAFESGILKDVNHYVSVLRNGSAMTAFTASSSQAFASSSGKAKPPARSGRAESATSGKSLAPTDKQIDYATKLAARLGLELPSSVRTDFDACREFLDRYSSVTPPSEKALSFAESIAKRKSLSIPDKTKCNARGLSAWIDANK